MAGLLDLQTEEERIAQQRALQAYAGQVEKQQAKQELMTALGNTWPAQLAKSAYQAVRAPGDVAYGLLDPRSDEAIKRSADLAGLMGTGGLPFAQRNALGTGGGKMVQPAQVEIVRNAPRAAEYIEPTSMMHSYSDPVSGGYMNIVTRPTGPRSASVIDLYVPEEHRGKGVAKALQASVLQDFPSLQGQVSSKAAAKNAYSSGRRMAGNENATLDDIYRKIDEDSSVNLWTVDTPPAGSGLLSGTPQRPATTLSSSIEEKYPGLKLDLSGGGDKPLVVSRIELPKNMREQGIGTQIMREVLDYADKTGAQVALSPSSDFGGNKARLTEWYKSLGFVPNKGKSKDLSISEEMYRVPRVAREDLERGLI